MSTVNVNRVVDASGGVLAPISSVHRNRIINGAMVIDQRNNGASVTATDIGNAIYVIDRWAYRVLSASKLSYQRSTVAPAGFTNSILITSLSSYTVGASEFFSVRQPIEGFNVADFGWGTANAVPVTLSFWVRSSLTGTFGGSVWNNAENRAYVFSYSINAANTWEQKSVTIAGDTTGTWTTNNTTGLMLQLSVGAGSNLQNAPNSWLSSVMIGPTGQTNLAGTNGATFYITGVQLEKGTQATSFEYRQYGQELALCQRYYEQLGYGSLAIAEAGSTYVMCLQYRTQKRSAASIGLTVTSNIRLRQFGTADRDANTASAGNVAGSTTGASFKVSGFNSIGSTSTPACVCFTTTSEDGNLFFASAEL